MDAMQFETVKVALKQDATGFVLTLKIHPDEIPEELLRDYVGARYMIAMVRLNDDEQPVRYKSRTQQAGILCRDIRFHQWLMDDVKLPVKVNEKTATEYLYETCGIKSRTELNGNKEAQKLFDQMIVTYDKWRNEDEPF